MRVLIAVPCFNEELSIQECIDNLKKICDGNNYDICVFNDGSTDNTFKILENLKNITVLNSLQNIGLSKVFNNVIFFAKKNLYDYVVIFDADNQYPFSDVNEILNYANENKYDITIGVRDFGNNNIFSKSKNIIQIFGSKFISLILGIKIKDVTSGFRVYSNKAIQNIYSTSSFSYTIETLFYARKVNLEIAEFNLKYFNKTRQSRLFSSNYEYIAKTIKILLNSILLFKKNIIFYFYLLMLTPGILLSSRFFRNYIQDPSFNGNIQSLTVGMAIIIVATLVYLTLRIMSYTKLNLVELEKATFSPVYREVKL